MKMEEGFIRLKDTSFRPIDVRLISIKRSIANKVIFGGVLMFSSLNILRESITGGDNDRIAGAVIGGVILAIVAYLGTGLVGKQVVVTLKNGQKIKSETAPKSRLIELRNQLQELS